ncbi:galactose-1-phosphate uridylyltransferase [Acholeplasma granularum]|uniref:galactose-1-phosphate uridylyltransferase n=1 Tax=Acholeplasma granularum TaxID=264635 RepID=UPI0004BBF4FF|nr:galactose-1-phosphate uridylyltransferase [Acholeplasma granularum]
MIYQHIENLISYGIYNLLLDPKDVIYKRNLLWDALKLDGMNNLPKPTIDPSKETTPDKILNEIIHSSEFIFKNEENELITTKLMGILSLLPSKIIDKFHSFKSIEDSTNWFYDYQIKNNYIQINKINQNIIWKSKNTIHPLKITINLTKPELSNEEIKRKSLVEKNDYPLSLLAKENVGFKGNLNHPARQNLRTIPILLNNESWFWQYSPYGYFKEHLIAINDEYTPMVVDHATIKKLTNFVDMYPHYFIGSNASLPIIGGSILSHEHFQGGRETLPLMKVREGIKFIDPEFLDVNITKLNWYSSVLRFESINRKNIINAATKILNHWKSYSNPKIDIISNTNNEMHNSATIIVRRTNDAYILDMILRNNRTNKDYPQGIFHAHKKHHHIKSEGIGLIEAMGLFILPVRLKRQINTITDYLYSGEEDLLTNDLNIHKEFINYLKQKTQSKKLNKDEIHEIIKNEINLICEDILINIAVFKPNMEGQMAFDEFLLNQGLEREKR